MIEIIQTWLDQYPALDPWLMIGGVVVVAAVAFVIARYFVARGMVYLATRTKNKYDDLIVAELRPFRFAWLAPLVLIYYLADLMPEAADVIRQFASFFMLWIVVLTLSALLNAVNAIYEASENYRGVSIQGYLDLGKIFLLLVAVILTVSLFTGESPLVLLSGLGALMAVLLLLFRDTLLSFVASLQIQSSNLLKEGDWIEVPSYGADGDVLNIALHTIKVQNFNKTITVIPTYKLLEAPFKNWRGMQESGGRRIKRAIHVDLNSIRFCDREMIERYQKIDLVREYVEARMNNGEQITNVGVFRAYIGSYLRSRPDINQEMILLVRQLAPSPTGLPLELYAFANTTAWEEYEAIQADIFDHLVAAIRVFDLQVFQQPTGVDFRALSDVEADYAE